MFKSFFYKLMFKSWILSYRIRRTIKDSYHIYTVSYGKTDKKNVGDIIFIYTVNQFFWLETNLDEHIFSHEERYTFCCWACWVKSSGRITQFTQSSEKISVKTKLHAKLYSFHDRIIHVRGGIYRALVFVFYIKWLFYPWSKYLQPFI
jgi:hypothetical protein